MAKKPTYEELERKVKELENEAFERKKAEEALRENEAKYRTLVEQLPSAIYIAAIDEASTTLFISPQIEEILGFKPDEWKQDHDIWLIQIHPDDRERVLAEVEASHKIGKPFLSEYRMTTRDGRTIWIRDQAKIVRDDESRPLFLQGMMSDITDLKQAEEALRESEEKYRSIYENIQDVYYEVTLDGIILEVSPSIEEISHYKREEIIGKSSYDIYIDPGKRDKFVKELLKNGKVTDYEILLKDKDGSQGYCSMTAKLVSDKHGNPAKIIGSMRNIARRKLAEQALRESEAQKRAILDASIDRIRYIDKDMKIIWANKTAAMEVDMSPEKLVGQACHRVFVDRETPCEECPTVRARETGKIERVVMYQPKVKGVAGGSYWDNYSVPLKNREGDIISFIQIARNITDQKVAEEHIHTLTQQLMKVQENERQMISRELHDRVGQDLSTIKIGLDTLIDNQPGVLPETRQRLLKLSKMLQDSIMVIRDLSYDLRPPPVWINLDWFALLFSTPMIFLKKPD